MASSATNAIPHIPSPIGQLPQSILYFRCLYEIVDDELSPTYSYDDTSGIYPLGAGISSFINQVLSNSVDTANRVDPLPGGPGTPVVIEQPCYVVMAIASAEDPQSFGIAQLQNSGPVKTSDTYPDYFNRVLVHDSGSTGPAHVAYFRARSPKLTGSLDEIDHFNLYLMFPISNGVGTGILDPDIKNIGH